MKDLTQAMAKQLLSYDADTGKFTWKNRERQHFKSERDWKIWNTKNAGKEAFTAKDAKGYSVGRIFGRACKAHRIAWLMTHGCHPDVIDHINGDPADNRAQNLRNVSHKANGRNTKLSANNSSGINGVFWDKKRQQWEAKIKVDGRSKHLGYFKSKEDAKAIRSRADNKFGFHENHGGVR
ncbi:HNH endonuclease signature motif containing protein [uncultured Roseibium sp.]|uniref:HNH endonuclease signature motif containing protein n=1 Tax=uncultured Roseibium sp. TaxID=1936171 RepID=UPI0026270EB2|nr:HNH endonuclease signature motif containing protein [uncultured Roseibium sp.]